jgi:hypothetical protein
MRKVESHRVAIDSSRFCRSVRRRSHGGRTWSVVSSQVQGIADKAFVSGFALDNITSGLEGD